ncbi:MAG: phosphoribosyl-AMP cyclohydrolase [Euryarchaeota archaeon]|nr:phosphoribosyl-AMP cyclohydrolase [Euryarchaeota archaeon]
MEELLEKVNFRVRLAGEELAIAVVQDYRTQEVLMVAFMNREALAKTLETGRMTYYSTSRRKLWVKGETSGNFQTVKEVRLDCDGDALLFRVEQLGAACHEGYASCFHRVLRDGGWKAEGERLFDPEKVYGGRG